MRIVGGTWRGRSFDAPEGRGTRPTTDRMRETIASMVLSALDLDLSGSCVLDAFAGSGGMGLELLSRGANKVTFCERDRRAAALVRRNCQTLGAKRGTWEVCVGDVFKLVDRGLGAGPFTVVFLDPPYALDASEVTRLVSKLDAGGQLAPRALVVYERSANAAGLTPDGMTALRSRSHGGTSVDLLRKD